MYSAPRARAALRPTMPSLTRGLWPLRLALVSLLMLPVATAPSVGYAATSAEQLSGAEAAAGWAAAQLGAADHIEGEYGPDPGLTADVVLALAATNIELPRAQAAADWLSDQAADYVSAGVPKSVLAGSAAKLILVSRAVNRNPKTFAKVDLPQVLLGQLTEAGKFADSMNYGGPTPVDNSTTFTQALAILALGSATPDSALSFLADSSCPDGGYPVFYPSADQPCESDVDGTGIVVQALLAQGADSQAAPAITWLVDQQQPDGAFQNSGPGAAANSNSTALATQALAAGGQTTAAAKGADWLLSRQVACGGRVASERGAIGYLEPQVDGSALRATAQAIPALAGQTLAEIAAGPPQSVPSCAPEPAPSPSPKPTSEVNPTPAPGEAASPTLAGRPGTGPAGAPAQGAAVARTSSSSAALAPVRVQGRKFAAAPPLSATSAPKAPRSAGASPTTSASPSVGGTATKGRAGVAPNPTSSSSAAPLAATATGTDRRGRAVWGVGIGVVALLLWLLVLGLQRRAGTR